MADFTGIYGELRALLLRAAAGMSVTEDRPGQITLSAAWPNPYRPKERMFFGMAKASKAYASLHLMPVYTHPALLNGLSPQLKRRMQGKSCFNFTAADPVLLAEIEALTRRCAQTYAAPWSASAKAGDA